nr:3-phosphoglycerate dehydrogenase [Desulfobulbaceae bacterium]
MKIQILNSIAREGLDVFPSSYEVGPDITAPDGILVRSSPVDTELFPSAYAISRAGAGVNNITVDKATQQGICVFNTPGANANAVAELVFIMLGAYARNIHLGLRFFQDLTDLDDDHIAREVEQKKSQFKGFELAGKTLGVIGLGQIGVRVANGGTSRGMRVLGFDPYPAMANIHALSPDVTLARSTQEILRESDIISLHVPLSQKTEGLVNQAFLEQLKADAVLINFARGKIVVDSDIIKALDSNRLRFHLTDFPSRLLLGHPKVICTPHLGASTEESEEHCSVMAATQLKNYLELGSVTHSVNFPTAESIPKDAIACRLIMINQDIPGMIGFATQVLGRHGINISSYINESNGQIGYNIIDLESRPSEALIKEIESNKDVIRTRSIFF